MDYPLRSVHVNLHPPLGLSRLKLHTCRMYRRHFAEREMAQMTRLTYDLQPTWYLQHVIRRWEKDVFNTI